MDSNSKKGEDRVEVSDFSFRDFSRLCLSKWMWFLLSMIVCVGIGFLYIQTRQPAYERSEEILIKDQDSGGGIDDIADAFSSFGLVASNTNVYNELISLKSPAVMYEVAKRLSLDMNYNKRGGMHKVTLYGNNLPWIVNMKGVGLQEAASLRLVVMPGGDLSLRKFVRFTPDGKEKHDTEVVVKGGNAEVKTPLGMIEVAPNPDFTGVPLKEGIEVDVSKMPMQTTVEHYGKKLKGDLVDQDADVIELSIKDVSVQRAVDILNLVLAVYNEEWIKDKNKMAVATSSFIADRLRLIERELGDVDASIAKYQNKTGTPDLVTSAKISMEKEALLDQSVLELENKLALAEYMKEFIRDTDNRFNIIPLNTGIDNPVIEKEIASYNAVLLARNKLVANSSENNPLVADYDARLNGMRQTVAQSVENQVTGVTKLLNNARSERLKTGGEIAGTSMTALPLLSDERQQKVKERLYLFLLQKREENELSRKFTADNTRVITPPMGSLEPVSPRKVLILALTFAMGFLIPLMIFYFRMTGDTKVRSKKDFEGIRMPFAGEIPQVGGKDAHKRKKMADFRHNQEERAPLSVVEEGKRDVVNEAFRVVRSNIEFMSGRKSGCEVVMLTSFNPGSGKSFISYNLGLTLALKKKRVLLVDCDLRHGSASMYVGMPSKGLTDCLAGKTEDWRSFVSPSPANPLLTVLPVGKMPPNPAELLENGKLVQVVEEAKNEYDYILLDCPPVNIVVDTQIVGRCADRTLFVVRAGLLEKGALKELNEFYDERKFSNMSVILNGTEAVHSRYYTYGNYQSYVK